MVILGIDPAIRTTGYGVVKVTNGNFEVIDCGVIANSPRLPHSECLRRLYGGIRELIAVYAPQAVSIEEPFVGRNSATAIILGMARGAIIAALAEHSVPCYTYTPRKAKKSAVGSGSATKEQIAVMLAAQFDIEVEQIPLDSTDAIALAICHGQIIARGEEMASLLTKPI